MTRVLFFGRPADRLGPELDIDLPSEGLTLGALRALIIERHPEAAEVLLRPGVRGSVDKTVSGEDAHVGPDTEVAFFSVFSGG